MVGAVTADGFPKLSDAQLLANGSHPRQLEYLPRFQSRMLSSEAQQEVSPRVRFRGKQGVVPDDLLVIGFQDGFRDLFSEKLLE